MSAIGFLSSRAASGGSNAAAEACVRAVLRTALDDSGLAAGCNFFEATVCASRRGTPVFLFCLLSVAYGTGLEHICTHEFCSSTVSSSEHASAIFSGVSWIYIRRTLRICEMIKVGEMNKNYRAAKPIHDKAMARTGSRTAREEREEGFSHARVQSINKHAEVLSKAVRNRLRLEILSQD
jgi:hypothetical protein